MQEETRNKPQLSTSMNLERSRFDVDTMATFLTRIWFGNMR